MSEALAPGGVLRVVVNGQDIVVWRGSDGTVRAWENRCPHRGMRLSYGFVRGNRLTCLYHGWGYDGQGSCVSIPAHPSLTPPKTIKVNRYDAAESAGLLWVAAAGANDPLQDPGGKWLPVQSIDVSRPLEEVRLAIANAGPANEDDLDAASAADAVNTSGTSAEAVGSDSTVIEFKDERLDRKVLCALQAVGETSTAIHILVSAEGAGQDDAVRRTYAKWGRRIRREQSTNARAPLALVAASAAERHTRPLA